MSWPLARYGPVSSGAISSSDIDGKNVAWRYVLESAVGSCATSREGEIAAPLPSFHALAQMSAMQIAPCAIRVIVKSPKSVHRRLTRAAGVFSALYASQIFFGGSAANVSLMSRTTRTAAP